jgi:hypothetical protein
LIALATRYGCAADSHQIRRLVFPDRFDRGRATFGLADHRDQAGLGQHHLGEFVHPRGRRWAGRANGFVANRINRTDVVNDAVGEVDRQLFAFRQHVLDAFVGRVAAGQHLAVEQQRLTGFPGATSAGVRVSRLTCVEVSVFGVQLTFGHSRGPVVSERPARNRRDGNARGASQHSWESSPPAGWPHASGSRGS